MTSVSGFLEKRTVGLPAVLCHLVSLLFLVLAAGWGRDAQAEIVITDAAGREVHLARPAQRIVTNESLLLLSLALLDDDPVARIAGWAAPRRIDGGIYAAFRKRFPKIDTIPKVGGVVPGNVSAEPILSVEPDLFVVSIWQPGWETVTHQLEASGVPVLFLDGPRTTDLPPAEAAAFSLALLGDAIGARARADAFSAFVKDKYALIGARLAGVTDRPDVLIDVQAGTLCCYTPGKNNRISQAIEFAGGHNIGAEVAAGYDGQLNIEYVLGIDPKLYIGTGSPHLAALGGLVVGGGIEAEAARHSLADVTSRNLLGELTAVRQGRAFAISHQLTISALSVLALECFAKWTHPERFADLDPARSLDEINRRFLAVPLEGTFWIGLNP